MITVISGTDRKNSNTRKVADEYVRMLQQQNVEVQLLALEEYKHIIKEGNELRALQEQFLFPVDKMIIVVPEYNGSYPGILKLLIDHSDIQQAWWYKKVLITGVSTGRAGNLRGMEHLSGVLLHLRMILHYNRLPLSTVNRLFNEQNQFSDQATLSAIENQINEFLEF